MTQELLDLRQLGARAEQLGCCEVSQPMRMDAAEAGPFGGGGHDLRHGGCAQPSERSEQANEHGAPEDAGRPPVEVRSNRVADICRQRHALDSMSLAVNDDLASAPPQVVQPQVRELSDAQAETGQRSDDGENPCILQGFGDRRPQACAGRRRDQGCVAALPIAGRPLTGPPPPATG